MIVTGLKQMFGLRWKKGCGERGEGGDEWHLRKIYGGGGPMMEKLLCWKVKVKENFSKMLANISSPLSFPWIFPYG